MMFTTPCFIKKSTYKLRKKLDDLGYKLFGAELNEDLCIFTDPECGVYSIEYLDNILHPEETDSIDCGENEELFLAISALRDNSNNEQWFVMDIEVYTDIPQGTWFKSSKEKQVGLQIDPMYCHKATEEELIKHFK